MRLCPLCITGALVTAAAGGCSANAGDSTASTRNAVTLGGPIIGLAGKCLDDNGDGTSDGNRIQLWDCNGTDAQNWTYTAEGTFVGPGGKCLDVTGNVSTSGTWATSGCTTTARTPDTRTCS